METCEKCEDRLEKLDQELRDRRDKNFDVTVEAIEAKYRLYQDEARLSVTFDGGCQWRFGLNEREAKKVIEALMKHFGIAEILKLFIYDENLCIWEESNGKTYLPRKR